MRKTLIYTNDLADFALNFSKLPETRSWSDRYEDALNNLRIEIEEMNDVDTEAEDYVPLTEEEIRNTVYAWMDMDWDDVKYNLKHLNNDGECVVFGTIGRWNGTSRGFNFANSIYEAVMQCANGVDILDINMVNGHIEIDGYHHDGENHYEIHLLNERGLLFKERCEYGYEMPKGDITDRHYHKAMAHDLLCA